MCLYPKLIKNPKYRINKKNKGVVPVMGDPRVGYVPVGCKKCIECRKQKAREWIVRITEEKRHDSEALPVLLSFSEKALNKNVWKIKQECKKDGLKMFEGYDLDNQVATRAVRLFLDNWKHDKIDGKYRKSIKHWLITELGHEGTERVHLHGFVWSKDKNAIKKAWKHGHVWFGDDFDDKAITYFVKYIQKVDVMHKEYVSKMFVSMGIGKGYLNRWDAKRNVYKPYGETDESYVNRQGYKMALPIYYRNKLWNDDEREKLWIEKLDKGERYVLGTLVDVSTERGLQNFDRLQAEGRALNKRLKYGDDAVNWEQKKYEIERRNLIVKKRLDENEIVEYFDPFTGELL